MTREIERLFRNAKSKVNCSAKCVLTELERDINCLVREYDDECFPETYACEKKLIDKAIENNQVIRFVYVNQNKYETTTREFTPQDYTGYNSVAGYCHLRKARRQFNIDNMKCLEIVG